MEELLACRVCLITDTKLFDMFKCKLSEPYEILTGNQMGGVDGLPVYICSMCAALLRKSISFRTKCNNAQGILKYALMHRTMLTTDFIRTIDRKLHSLTNSLSTTTTETTETIDFDQEIKEEIIEDSEFIDNTDIDHIEENLEIKYESDEEPLAKKVKKKRKKKFKNETVPEELVFDDEIENDTIIEEVNDVESIDDIQVVVLSKEQQINEVLLRKNSFNYLNSFYKCDKCFKGFITDSTFKNHMARHNVLIGTHACDVCHTRWPNARSLRAHVVTSHERKFVCRRCNHISKSSHRAKEHSKWHLGFTYTCKTCGASFTKSTSHLTHMRLQHPSDNCCDLCGDSFIGEYGLAMHRKKAHRDEDSKLKSDSQCVLCGAQFRSLDALNRHISATEDNACNPSMRPCLSCGEGFNTEDLLKEHLKLHVKDDNVRCEECNRTFAHEKSYAIHYQRVHLRVKSGKREVGAGDRVVCEICGKKCNSNATLVYHQRTHTGEKPHQCSECPKRFSVYQLLQRPPSSALPDESVRRLSEAKPSISTSPAIAIAAEIHRRTHTGERPYKCTHCPKAFKHKAALNRHDRVHTGVKPYSCQHCGKSFSQSNSMKTHVKTVHLKLPAPYRHRKNKNE